MEVFFMGLGGTFTGFNHETSIVFFWDEKW
jgi:hypothetical protein